MLKYALIKGYKSYVLHLKQESVLSARENKYKWIYRQASGGVV